MLLGLDLDGVVCDIGPSVATRITARFGVATHPDTWRSYDLRLLRLGVPEAHLHAFLDDLFADPLLYEGAAPTPGAQTGVRRLLDAGWEVVGITARPSRLARVTTDWLSAWGILVDAVHHTNVGAKAEVARALGVQAAIEDNPFEAELLGEVCQSWLLDRPYNRDHPLQRATRLSSWDDAVGRLCQLPLFA